MRDVMARWMVARAVSRQPSITSDHVDARKENIKRALRAQRSSSSRCSTRSTMLFRACLPSPTSMYRRLNTRAIYTRVRKVFSIFFLHRYGSSAGSRIRIQREKYLAEIYILAFVHFFITATDNEIVQKT